MSINRAVAVSVEHLSKTYPVPLARLKGFFRRSKKPPVEALRDVSLEIDEGEIFGLIGPNGAGKTTLTKIIATLVQPTTGTVTVRGHDSVRDAERVRAQIGLATAEERSFYWRLTGVQNLIFFARLYGMEERAARRRIDELLTLFELKDATRRRFGELSTGNKQRLAVARALLPSPPVLLLDEPTRSLDPLAAARLRYVLSQLVKVQPHVSILLTSHNLGEVEELCDRVAVIGQGSIRAVDTPKNLRALHRQTERVSIQARGISARELEDALAAAASGEFEIAEQSGALTLSFTREADDDLLDKALRLLAGCGATVVAVDSEQATLLDVLLAYQEKEEAR